MIKLKFNCEFTESSPPFAGKLSKCNQVGSETSILNKGEVKCFYDEIKRGYSGRSSKGNVFIPCGSEYDFDGDVFLFFPERKEAQRIIRRGSKHNTILFTEECDQLCVMCSQPPKDIDSRWLIPLYRDAIELSDQGIEMGISGGEPTLYKEELFSLLEYFSEKRPDVSFHILTNAQHFSKTDRPRLKAIHKALRILWGIPLYSSSAQEHDDIVKKPGAFTTLIENLFTLASSGGAIELRTVVIKKNILDLPYIAKFITKNTNFMARWAIMNLEPIGYAKFSREELFFDYSQFFEPIANAIETAELYKMSVSLFNFPLCTVPERYRYYCADSISDWKKKYLPLCNPCTQKDKCGGFFEWYNKDWEMAGIGPIT